MAQYLESVDVPDVTELTIATPKPEPESPKPEPEPSWLNAEVEVSVATYQAYQVLYYAFMALFTFAGMDKFLHLLTTWESYVAPGISSVLHMSPGAITIFAAFIELLVAAAVALKPRIGSWAVTGWLGLIVINLLAGTGHGETVLFTLALGAAGYAFTRLAAEIN
jgi:hypothetical protein